MRAGETENFQMHLSRRSLRSGMQEVVIFLEDFSWTNWQTLFDNLRKPKSGGVGMKREPWSCQSRT